MSTLMSTIWLDPRPKNFAHPHCSYKPPLRFPPPPPNINARHKAACCAGFRILLWANLSRCSKAEGPLTPASRSAVSRQPVAMVTSALWQADAAAAAAAASCMMRPPSLNTDNCVVVITSRSAPHHIALCNKLPPGFVEPARQKKKKRREKNDRSDFVYTCTCARTDRTNACVVGCKIPSN